MLFFRRRQAMTLVELMLAMSILSMVAVAAGGMLTAVSYGSAERTDLRALVVKQELIANRIGTAVRDARQILDCDDDQLVLWVSDTNNDQTAQLSEVRWIQWDEDTQSIDQTTVVFPESMTADQRASLDTQYLSGSSLAVQTAAVLSYVQTQRWADDVSGWELGLSGDSAASSKLVSYRVTFTIPGKPSQTIIGAAALRSE
jgi:prepilin-type N-terminal cleavage/methylation domain-containing protein